MFTEDAVVMQLSSFIETAFLMSFLFYSFSVGQYYDYFISHSQSRSHENVSHGSDEPA